MAIAPINFVSTYGLVPIFAWIPIDTPEQDSEAPATPAISCSNGIDSPAQTMGDTTARGGQTQSADRDTSPKMQLVFMGFQWRPGFEIASYPRPTWMAGLASGSADPSDPSTKQDDPNKRDADAARLRAKLESRHTAPSPVDPIDDAPTGTEGTPGNEG